MKAIKLSCILEGFYDKEVYIIDDNSSNYVRVTGIKEDKYGNVILITG